MNPPTPFKPDTTVFHLRSDFPIQFCFPEFCGSPRARTIIMDAARSGTTLPVPMDDYLAVDPSTVELGRYFCYGGCGVKDSEQMHWFIWDGIFLMPVEREGLFSEMLARATRAYGKDLEKNIWPQIFPFIPFDKWEFAQHVIFHDRQTGSAGQVTWAEGRPFLRKKPSP